ncbi:MAG TPA: hypothetical protein VFX76_02485, partial [Roseiflexaceae bacterium]|nr:hypothetical protein [Roseiflexaceae bacterium]
MSRADQHFARVEPIVGSALRSKRVALIGLPAAAPLVTYLASCGVGRWLWAIDDATDSSVPDELRASLLAQHGEALHLDAQVLTQAEWVPAIHHQPVELLIAVGDGCQLAAALDLAAGAGVP